MLQLKDGRTFIIAEAGTAHAAPNAAKSVAKALRLVKAAANTGVDAIKFQWFTWPGIEGHINEEPVRVPMKQSMFCWIDGDEARLPRWQASII